MIITYKKLKCCKSSSINILKEHSKPTPQYKFCQCFISSIRIFLIVVGTNTNVLSVQMREKDLYLQHY